MEKLRQDLFMSDFLRGSLYFVVEDFCFVLFCFYPTTTVSGDTGHLALYSTIFAFLSR